MPPYDPKPIDTSSVALSHALTTLTEQLAEHNHDVWAAQRIADGWTWGPERNDPKRQHPGLVPYRDLSESEKNYDRNTALEILKAITVLGYQIVPA